MGTFCAASAIDHVLELGENGLRRFRAQISLVRLGRRCAHVGGEHQIERAGFGELRAVFRVESAGVFDLLRGFSEERRGFQTAERVELSPDFPGAFRRFAGGQQDAERIMAFLAGGILGASPPVDRAGLWFHVIGAEALARQEAIAHRIAESIHVSRRLPDGGVHDDGGVESDHVFALAGHGAPPGIAQVAFQFRAERAVIPEAIDAAIDFRALKNEAAALAERHDLFHQGDLFRLTHREGEGARGWGKSQAEILRATQE